MLNQNIKTEWSESTTMDLLIKINNQGDEAYKEAIVSYTRSRDEIITVDEIELLDTDFNKFNPSLFADHSDYAYNRLENELYEYGEVA